MNVTEMSTQTKKWEVGSSIEAMLCRDGSIEATILYCSGGIRATTQGSICAREREEVVSMEYSSTSPIHVKSIQASCSS